MNNFERILKKINGFKLKSPNYFTNAYIEVSALFQLLERETTEIYETERSVAVFFEDNGVHRLYAFAETAEIAAGVKLPQSRDNVIFEIIEQDKNNALTDCFVSNGWEVYQNLMQLRNVVPLNYAPSMADTPVEIAGLDDAEAVYQMLFDTFDINVSHLPNKGQLKENIAKGETLIIRDRDKIAAFAIFETTGKKTKYWYQLVVGKDYRGKNYAQALTEFEFLRVDSGTIYSIWVPADYPPVINLHKKNGAKEYPRYLTVFFK